MPIVFDVKLFPGGLREVARDSSEFSIIINIEILCCFFVAQPLLLKHVPVCKDEF